MLGLAVTALATAPRASAPETAATGAPAAAASDAQPSIVADEPVEALDAPATSSAPEADAPEPFDGLAALYAHHGLAVPTSAIPKDQRPGCTPTNTPPSNDDDNDVSSDSPPPPPPVDLVPEDQLPAPAPLVEFTPDATIAEGHGMWLWQYTKTEGGDYDRMIQRAVDAGLDHVWVRVGDSRDGFYAEEYLDEFVPRAHAAGLDVIGWGFPYLLDPARDTAWTNEAIAWVGPHGRGLDAYSPDIERETEGVVLTAKRVEVHLAGIRAANPDLPIIATVYPATDWILESGYPYETMAPYVDAFATMDYWSCGDAGLRAANSINRLEHLRPVHVIGQAFSGGRKAAPGAAETWRFLDTAVREEALGASWWVWQLIGDEQWDAVSAYPWNDAVAAQARNPVAADLPE